MIQKLTFTKKQLIITLKNRNYKEIILYTVPTKLGVLLMNTNTFENDEGKLAFIFDHLGLNNSDIAKKLGVTQGTISKMRTTYNSTLKPVYLYAFEHVYDIPYKIFEDKNINTPEQIIKILDEKKKKVTKDIFYQNEDLLTQLVGDWYAYLYPSNSSDDIYEIKTTIFEDGRVKDANRNHGNLYLGKRQSMIIKEARNSEELISITFDNRQVAFGMFSFTLVSKINFSNSKMCNFGFFSKKELSEEDAKQILGEREKIQFKLDNDFEERFNGFIGIEE